MNDVRVVATKTETSSEGLVVTVKVLRSPVHMFLSCPPDVEDIPADIRGAIQIWLIGAKGDA